MTDWPSRFAGPDPLRPNPEPDPGPAPEPGPFPPEPFPPPIPPQPLRPPIPQLIASQLGQRSVPVRDAADPGLI